MPFIGTQPDVGGYSVLDNLTASATANYTLQKDSANFSPSSANQLLVSLNCVIQKPGTSFTVSGSTLTFSSALSSSDSIDFILAMGEPLLVGTPSDGAVNTTQLATNAVSTAKIASSAVTDAKIASSAVTTAKLATGLDLTGKVATGHETLSNHVAVNEFSAVGYTSANIFVTVGNITIPKPGIWRVSAQMRLRWNGGDYFTKMYLTSAAQAGNSNTIASEIFAAGEGANSASRMLMERVTVSTFGNLLVEPAWIVDVPTGLSSGGTVHFTILPTTADGLALNNNDANGRPGAHAIKIAETTTSGSTITTRGF